MLYCSAKGWLDPAEYRKQGAEIKKQKSDIQKQQVEIRTQQAEIQSLKAKFRKMQQDLNTTISARQVRHVVNWL